MFVRRLLEWVCACAEGYCCLKVEPVFRSVRQPAANIEDVWRHGGTKSADYLLTLLYAH
jgi:hypothetical protein